MAIRFDMANTRDNECPFLLKRQAQIGKAVDERCHSLYCLLAMFRQPSIHGTLGVGGDRGGPSVKVPSFSEIHFRGVPHRGNARYFLWDIKPPVDL